MASLFRNVLPNSRSVRVGWLASLILSLSLLMLPVLASLDGRQHADWQQFLGRFHPLLIHFPIALILLVPLLEVMGRSRPTLREAAEFVLSLNVLASLSAVVLGYLLAYGAGESGPVVTRHMWGGISLTILVMVSVLARPAWAAGRSRFVYPSILIVLLPLLAWTAHQGGTLTHGESYLTQYLPLSLKQAFGIHNADAKANVGSDSVYAKHIATIFDARCVACHGASKVEGHLRLDSYEALMKGGEDGAVIVAGQPEKSVLIQRVTLPPGHKGFMPAEGKPPLSTEEISTIKAWIAQGASTSVVSLKGLTFPDEAKDDPLPQVGDYSGLMTQISEVEKATGVKLTQVSAKPSDGLILNVVSVASTFNDAQLGQFTRFAPFIVEVELGRSALTDACFDTLTKFTHLRAIHLEETEVSGVGLQKLGQLSQLRYLNLSGTKVSAEAVAPLSSMKQLRHVYLFNTPAQPGPAANP